jgi:predicted  nucleic acid-binding Zn-ribbon protein
MNTIGKILVGVIFVASIMLMSLSIYIYSTQHKWSTLANKTQADLKNVQNENSKLNTKIAELETQKKELETSLQSEIAVLIDKNKSLTEEKTTLANEVNSYRDQADNAVKNATVTQENMKNMSDEVQKLRTDLADAQASRVKLLEQVSVANDVARTLALELATLKSISDQLSKDLAASNYLLTQLGYGDLKPDEYTKNVPPRIRGTVTEIRPNGLVEINVGRDDGLLQGHKLHVIRSGEDGASYLGQIEILDVNPNKAVGKIIPELRKGTIVRGDVVSAENKSI